MLRGHGFSRLPGLTPGNRFVEYRNAVEQPQTAAPYDTNGCDQSSKCKLSIIFQSRLPIPPAHHNPPSLSAAISTSDGSAVDAPSPPPACADGPGCASGCCCCCLCCWLCCCCCCTAMTRLEWVLTSSTMSRDRDLKPGTLACWGEVGVRNGVGWGGGGVINGGGCCALGKQRRTLVKKRCTAITGLECVLTLFTMSWGKGAKPGTLACWGEVG